MSHNFYLKIDAGGTQSVRHRRSVGGNGGDVDALAAGFEMWGPTTAGPWKPIQLGKGGPPMCNQNAAKAAASHSDEDSDADDGANSGEDGCSGWCATGSLHVCWQ